LAHTSSSPKIKGALQPAEKGQIANGWLELAIAGAKAQLILLALPARLKSCPVTKPDEAEFPGGLLDRGQTAYFHQGLAHSSRMIAP
jgi:hypothetical protein